MGPSNSSMNNVSTSQAELASLKNLRSPVPYLFGGLAIMCGVIAIALLILACSFRRYSSSFSSNDEEKSSEMCVMDVDQVSLEPKIVVVMPGENNPTYLAMPVSSVSHIDQQTLQN
ncbi:unnamed protein product [Vicia faba]|uniref:Uncharacterized protein n=1 Tax=Vicia faba TaxID=3906 RepID=A0AAV0Z5N9_VICFA|nr:unnamed protein product [Vicia faba]